MRLYSASRVFTKDETMAPFHVTIMYFIEISLAHETVVLNLISVIPLPKYEPLSISCITHVATPTA